MKKKSRVVHTAQVGTADAVAAQFAVPGKQVVDGSTVGGPMLDGPKLGDTTLDDTTLDGPGLDSPDPMVKHDTPVGAALTQPQTAAAEVITAFNDAAGHAVITQGTAALEIDAYVDGLH
jgi:hypothetical protein